MSDQQETSALIFVDGFGGMAVSDMSQTHRDIIQNLKDESIWEVFDGAEKLSRGIHKITLRFWWETRFPESGDDLVIETAETILLHS